MTWNTTATDWELLEKLNNDEVIRQIPLMVYLFLISLAGIPGNGLVCYIYKSQYSMSSSRWFIFFLGAVDIILCVVILPCELATLFQQYTFTNRIWCKFSAFFNLLMLISLGLTLLVVSIDRYRKVCKPLGWQINFKIARILCAACFTFSVVISLPVFVLPCTQICSTCTWVSLFSSHLSYAINMHYNWLLKYYTFLKTATQQITCND